MTDNKYQLGVNRDFVAQHYLIGGDWGKENTKHSHHYRLEIVLSHDDLDRHGYLVDIVRVKESLDGQVETYRDQTLNDLPAFEGLNPSLEAFARILAESIDADLKDQSLAGLTVKLWEDKEAWASYSVVRKT